MLITRYPVKFNSPTGIKVALGRVSPGIEGFTHRYMSDDIPASVGSPAQLWTDYVGGVNLPATNGPTVRALPDGRKYLEFDGVNDTMKTTSMAAGSVKTLVMVARARSTDTSTTILVAGSGVSINRGGTSGTMFNPGTPVTNASKLDNQWRVVIAVATPTMATLTIDGVKVSATPNAVWGTNLSLGANGSPNYFSPLDVVELITYDKELTDTEAATVRAAMKAAYPALLT